MTSSDSDSTFQLGDGQRLEYMNVYQVREDGEGYDLEVVADQDVVVALAGTGVVSFADSAIDLQAGGHVLVPGGTKYSLRSTAQSTFNVQVLGVIEP